jgi:hypothetical protein
MWEPQPLTTLRDSKACRGENFTFYLLLLETQVSRSVFTKIIHILKNGNNSADTANRLGVGRPRSWSLIPGRGKRFFFIPQRLDRLWGPHNLLSMCTGGSFPGVKRQGAEADHSPPSSVEVKNDGSTTSLPHTSLRHVALLIKSRDNFTLPLTHTMKHEISYGIDMCLFSSVCFGCYRYLVLLSVGLYTVVKDVKAMCNYCFGCLDTS